MITILLSTALFGQNVVIQKRQGGFPVRIGMSEAELRDKLSEQGCVLAPGKTDMNWVADCSGTEIPDKPAEFLIADGSLRIVKVVAWSGQDLQEALKTLVKELEKAGLSKHSRLEAGDGLALAFVRNHFADRVVELNSMALGTGKERFLFANVTVYYPSRPSTQPK